MFFSDTSSDDDSDSSQKTVVPSTPKSLTENQKQEAVRHLNEFDSKNPRPTYTGGGVQEEEEASKVKADQHQERRCDYVTEKMPDAPAGLVESFIYGKTENELNSEGDRTCVLEKNEEEFISKSKHQRSDSTQNLEKPEESKKFKQDSSDVTNDTEPLEVSG